MHALHIQADKQVAALSKKLRRLERCGKYEKALSELGDLWSNFDSLPAIEDFSKLDKAEVLLRCGALIGFHGHNKQIQNAQTISKDFLTEAREKFSELADTEKVAECENYLALAYWRTGEFNEAEAWIDCALSHNLLSSNNITLYSEIIRGLIYLSTNRHQEIIFHLPALERDFLECSDAGLIGDFYNHLGLSYKNLGNISSAQNNLQLARHYHQKSRHKLYLGAIENNLAQLYKLEGRFTKAHEAIDGATKTFRQIKDKTREGFSLDTKALIYFAEGNFADALCTVEKALTLLRKSENKAYQVETLLTKSKVLLYLDDFTGAVQTLIEAVDIARVQTSEEAAKRLIVEFEKTLNEKKAVKSEAVINESKMELILPMSIADYADYRGMRINNSHLENIGIKKGSLAVLAEDKIDRGDLVAIAELTTGEISCGFYDADFGIVCLERTGCEPLLFNETDIKVLGKIIGVCNSRKDSEGKMIVETLNLQNRI